MTMTCPPVRVVAGTTIKWTSSSADYEYLSGWRLSFVAVWATGQTVVEATEGALGDHEFVLSVADTLEWDAAQVKWQIVASNAGEAYEESSGFIVVVKSFLQETDGLDASSNWERILADLNTGYADFVGANGARTSFSIAGRSTTFSSAAEFVQAINNAETMVARERAADNLRQGKNSGRNIGTRMS